MDTTFDSFLHSKNLGSRPKSLANISHHQSMIPGTAEIGVRASAQDKALLGTNYFWRKKGKDRIKKQLVFSSVRNQNSVSNNNS